MEAGLSQTEIESGRESKEEVKGKGSEGKKIQEGKQMTWMERRTEGERESKR